MILKFVFAILFFLHHDKLAMIDISKILKAFHTEVIPLHQKHSGHQSMGHEDTNAGKIIISKLPPQTLIESTNSIICICCRFTVGYPIEKMSIIRTFLPHSFHLRRTWLKVSEILLAQSGFFI